MSPIPMIRPLCIAGTAALVVASFAPAGAQAAEPLADLGIEAPEGVASEKNLAAGNGNPAQCTGIVCLSAP